MKQTFYVFGGLTLFICLLAMPFWIKNANKKQNSTVAMNPISASQNQNSKQASILSSLLNSENKTTPNKKVNNNKIKKEYTDLSFKKFNELFGPNSKLTDLQKEKLFDSKYKNKTVKWSGVVSDVRDTILSGIVIDLKPLKNQQYSYLTLKIDNSQSEKAFKIKKNDVIQYEALLTGFSSYIGPFIKNVEI